MVSPLAATKKRQRDQESPNLRKSSANLAQVREGVRAVERHCAPIGPVVTKVNSQLRTISDELAVLADLGGQAAGAPPRRIRRR